MGARLKFNKSIRALLSNDGILRALISIELVLIFALFIAIGIFGYISDSEIWSISLAKNISNEWKSPWVFTRPIFYFVLGIFESAGSSSKAIFYLAKIAFTINGALICGLTFFLSNKIAGGKSRESNLVALFACLLLLANTGFINQGSRVRSDLLAATLILLALSLTIEAKLRLRSREVLVWLSPILATPKSILLVFSFLFLKIPRGGRRFWFEVLIIFIVVLTFVYPQGVDHFTNSFQAAFFESNASFFKRWMYVERIFAQNNEFIFLLFARALALPIRISKNYFRSNAEREVHESFGIFTLSATIVLILTPEKVPFLLAAYIPIFSIFAALIIDDLSALMRGQEFSLPPMIFKRLRFAAIAILSLSISGGAYKKGMDVLENDSSGSQMIAIETIEKYLDRFPNANYFDVIGIVPKRATIRMFAGPNDAALNAETAEWVMRNPPDLVFFTNKCIFLGQDFSSFVIRDYFPIGGGAFARWFVLPPTARTPHGLIDFSGTLNMRIGTPQLQEITALVTVIPRIPWMQKYRLDELSQLMKKSKKVQLIAISPFSLLERDIGTLSTLFMFDMDY